MIDNMAEDNEQRRPLGLVLLSGLYLFFFIVTLTSYGKPLPFLGRIYDGNGAKALIFIDSLISLYLFLGIMKRQYFTWRLLICYNVFEILNSIVNLNFITVQEIERVIGEKVNQQAMVVNNIICALAILLLTQFIYRHRHYFDNRQKYLF